VVREARSGLPNAGTLLGVGASFGVCVGLGIFVGVLADRAAGTSPLLTLLGLVLGIFVGAASAYQVIRPYTRRSSTDRSTEQNSQTRQ
jgi:F0F1-type ATP synthase assembly protein I